MTPATFLCAIATGRAIVSADIYRRVGDRLPSFFWLFISDLMFVMMTASVAGMLR